MLSGKAPAAEQRGDAQQRFAGKTVEINNTDAEGRLVLADGVFYAHNTLKVRAANERVALLRADNFRRTRLSTSRRSQVGSILGVHFAVLFSDYRRAKICNWRARRRNRNEQRGLGAQMRCGWTQERRSRKRASCVGVA